MSTTIYTWNPLTDSVIEESDGSGNVLCTYTNKPSRFGPLVSENRNGTTSYYHADVIGSTRLTTNGSQAVVDSFLFDAWGNTVASTEPTPTPYQWGGKWGYQTDTTLTNTYVRARTYESSLSRWLSIDPLSSRMSRHIAAFPIYVYANNRPTLNIDPFGLDTQAQTFPTLTFPLGQNKPPTLGQMPDSSLVPWPGQQPNIYPPPFTTPYEPNNSWLQLLPPEREGDDAGGLNWLFRMLNIRLDLPLDPNDLTRMPDRHHLPNLYFNLTPWGPIAPPPELPDEDEPVPTFRRPPPEPPHTPYFYDAPPLFPPIDLPDLPPIYVPSDVRSTLG